MTTCLVLPPAARWESAGPWQVATLEKASGFGRVHRSNGLTILRVGDRRTRPDDAEVSPDAGGSLLTAVLYADGSAMVETRTAPPALLVSWDGTRLLPAAPGQRKPTVMAPGERLLLCSALALDSPPVGLVKILHRPAPSVLRIEPDALLREVLDDTDVGAAALVVRDPQATGPRT